MTRYKGLKAAQKEADKLQAKTEETIQRQENFDTKMQLEQEKLSFNKSKEDTLRDYREKKLLAEANKKASKKRKGCL